MNRLLLTAAVVCLIGLTPAILNAQFHMGVAPALGMNFNIHTGSDLPQSGTGFGVVFGGEADMHFTRSLGMIARLAFYDNRSGSFSTSGTQGGVNYTVDNSASLAYLNFEPLITISLPQSSFFFFGGPSLGFNIQGSGESTTTITTPGVTFPGGSTKQTSKASFKDLLVRFEFKIGAGYQIPIAKKINAIPQISFGFGLTQVQSDVSWRIMTLQLIVPVEFELM
jgi:hypothetical protein